MAEQRPQHLDPAWLTRAFPQKADGLKVDVQAMHKSSSAPLLASETQSGAAQWSQDVKKQDCVKAFVDVRWDREYPDGCGVGASHAV